ncbi:hypothetical protein BSL78_12928 [Apostichopus japonicus]|uniref:Uncharacterized protein n=1 Tax=Stichopus japonicus TaxID=307972 RepID=A0A2G8KQC8_STIJA|nr:hypothetical protein BSL78_12928 [Apostichopus japonicus]
MANYKTPPVFSEAKPYSRWIEEVKAWQEVTDLKKEKHGLAVALSLPEEGAKSIRDKVFNEIDLEDLKKETGVSTLIKFMDNVFKKDELSAAYEAYTSFDRYRRQTETTMEEFVTEFEKLYNKTKKYKMELPKPVLAFKLLESAQLEHKDRQLVLTAVDYKEPDKMFEQMQNSLKKFFGQQSMPPPEAKKEWLSRQSQHSLQHKRQLSSLEEGAIEEQGVEDMVTDSQVLQIMRDQTLLEEVEAVEEVGEI